MKKPVLLKTTLTVLSGFMLAACGSGSSSGNSNSTNSISRPTANNTPTTTANSAELTAAKEAAAKAEADLAKANAELATAKEALSKVGTSTNELAAAKKAATDAETAKKTAETALAKANADLEAAKAATEKAVTDAKKQAVEDYKKELAAKAKQEADKAKLTNVKKAVADSFKGDDKHFVATQNSTQGDKVHTNILKINHTDGTAKVEVNANTQPEITGITINGVRIALLENQINANSSEKIALAKLEGSDFADGKLPEGAKGGWVGSWAGSRWGEFGKMRFGVYTDEKNVSHLFVNGQPATDTWMNRVSSGGLAYNYKGSAIIGKDGNYTPLANAITGTVDFETKKVDLNLQADTETKYNFGGDIQGNTFAGERNGVVTQGAFYGYADTLGGVLQINEGKFAGYHGVYGAGQDGRPFKSNNP